MVELFITCYILVVIVLEIAYGVSWICDEQSLPYSPSKMYKNSKFNLPSCIIFAIGIWILFPISSIWHFINWIIRIGRK